MDRDTYEKAVRFAQQFKTLAEERYGGELGSIGAGFAHDFHEIDPSVEEHNLRVLIERPEKPKAAWDTLNHIAQHYLRNGNPMPPLLSEWVADVLNDQLLPTKQRKRPRLAKHGDPKGTRNVAVQATVAALCSALDIDATRNRESEPGVSACDVVADVWGLKYTATEKIWESRPSEFRKSVV